MRLRRERKFRLLPDSRHLDIARIAPCDRRVRRYDVRHFRHEAIIDGDRLPRLRIKRVDLRLDILALRDRVLSFRVAFRVLHERIKRVLFGLKHLDLLRASHTRLVGGEQLVEIERNILVHDGRADLVRVLADESDVEHSLLAY